MIPPGKPSLQVFLLLVVTFIFCEYFIYDLVIGQCSWPELKKDDENSDKTTVKALLLADPHLLGPYKGHWWDKLRREWQMLRSFEAAVNMHKPEVVFILGDIFDEGLRCTEEELIEYHRRFLTLFPVPNTTEMYVIPGNHDIGFHDEIYVDVMHTFEKLFNISCVQFLDIKGNYFILINSMALEGDGCALCEDAEKKIKNFAVKLNCEKNKKNCSKSLNLPHGYSRPIVLQHFPMYRKSDSECNEIDEAPLPNKNKEFKEKWDCLSQQASEMLYNKLNPRLVFSGHIHHGCHVVHKGDIHEYTLASFSWRNKNDPTFLLAEISPTRFSVNKCSMPKETTIHGMIQNRTALVTQQPAIGLHLFRSRYITQ